MIIRTFEHEYPVMSVLKTGEDHDCYICFNEASGGLCRIMCIKDRSRFPDIVNRLTTTLYSKAFTDLIEHFVFDDMLCIVMKYTQGFTLADKLEAEKPSLGERLEIGRCILERAVIQDIPGYFLDKCLSPDCIIVAPDLSVSFNYPIDDIAEGGMDSAEDRIESLLRLLFARELERKVPDKLMEFFGKLPELLEYSIMELYSEYYMMKESIDSEEAEGEQPRSIWYKIWDKVREVGRVLKRFVMVGLMLLALGFLLFTILFPSRGTNQPNFDRIGTVTINKEL